MTPPKKSEELILGIMPTVRDKTLYCKGRNQHEIGARTIIFIHSYNVLNIEHIMLDVNVNNVTPERPLPNRALNGFFRMILSRAQSAHTCNQV